VPFRKILHDLLDATDGSLGAMFLDYEGESVQLLGRDGVQIDDLKIIGAYQGIFLTQLRKLCSDHEVGAPQRFKIDFAHTRILSCDLRDGYYLVLLTRTDANEGIAWQRLGVCRDRLLQEI
jgi:hypothetical protein